jgi:predicted O-methyltransferase YrrM
MSTSEAFELFSRKGLEVKFDLIYVDAAHDMKSVLHDITHSMRLLSADGIVCGDDWTWWGKEAPVRRAVESFARLNRMDITTVGDFWCLKKHRRTPGFQP